MTLCDEQAEPGGVLIATRCIGRRRLRTRLIDQRDDVTQEVAQLLAIVGAA